MSVPKISMALSGPTFSRLVYGVWRLADWKMDRQELLDLLEALLDLGITTVDHADIYGDYTCERIFGEALAMAPALRQKMQLVTKCGIKLVSRNRPGHSLKHYDTSRTHIIASVERSLQNLQTDHIDLLLIHRPSPLMDPDDIAAAFVELRRAGKVHHFGVSNFTRSQFDLLASRLDFPLVTNQIEVSVLEMSALHDGTVDHCFQLGISPMAWSPFAGGRLFRSEMEQAIRVRQALTEVGASLGGATVDQVALAWILRHPARIVPLLGTGNLARVKQASQALSYDLSREQWFKIWIASAGTEVP